MIHKEEKCPESTQESGTSSCFFKGHGWDGVLPGMLWTSFFICCYICPQVDDTGRWKMSGLHCLLRGQERPLSFLKEHGGDGVLPGMLWALFLICCFICPQLDNKWRRKMSWLHSGLRNVFLPSLKDMDETEYFLACYEIHFLYVASFVPN